MKNNQSFTRILLLVAVLSIAALPVFATPAGEGKGPIVVASKIDTEGALLGSMIVHLLEDAGFEVVDSTEFGTTDIIRRAIFNDEIDIYPEYTGNGGFFFSGTESSLWQNATTAYQTVKEHDFRENNIVWLQPAPANNTWAIAIRQDVAQAEGLVTLEDFAAFVNAGGTVKLAGSEEFVSRPDALPSFEEAYGFDLSDDQLLTLSGGNTATTIQAAARRTDGVNTAMAYGTDGALAALGLVVMQDSLGVQPVYEPAPIIRAEILDEYPEIADILGPVFQTLSLETLQGLNAKIAVDGLPAADVARDYIVDNGFIN
ncbi:MAG: ABC transporter substrate-binding protein [Spirochaetaceae bacterium]|nr:ABC transporter substrate-binding protein [Spirochaetaceae bacterium]